MGNYRDRRPLEEKATPTGAANQTTDARYSQFITSIPTDDTRYAPASVINEYEPRPGEHTPVGPRPPSPLISKVSKGLQTMTQKTHQVAKKTTSKGSGPSSSASSSSASSSQLSLQPTKSAASNSKSGKNKAPARTPDEVFLDNDQKNWPFGFKVVGRDGGETGRWYYRDQHGVGYESEEGVKHGWVTRTD